MAKFRKIFSTISKNYSAQVEKVGSDETITRFIFQSNHFTTSGRVKPAAISPNNINGRNEFSVYRVTDLPKSEVWAICKDFVDNQNNSRFAKARANCTASVYFSEALNFDADGKPHRRHANVIGWPDHKDKHKLKNIQQKISAQMNLELRSDSDINCRSSDLI